INLVIVGNWENSEYGNKLLEAYGSFDNLYLLPPIYNQNELDEIRGNCYVYIHGHSAGGTNPSLVEAMCLGLPILAYDVDYNRFTTKNIAIYFGNEIELYEILRGKISNGV